MIHTIHYFGHFDRNFRTLEPDTTTYRDRDGVEKLVSAPSAQVDGFLFRYMECREKEFVAVGVETGTTKLILRAPVLLIPARHTDDKGFFADPLFEDDSAARLLVDMILFNSERRDALARLIRQLEG